MKRQRHSPPVFLGLALAVGFLSAALAVAATPSPTTTELTISPSTQVAVGTLLTLKASVTSSGQPVSPGLVLFCNAAAAYCEDFNILGQAQLTEDGTASLNLMLPPGSHEIRAQFHGTTSNAPSSSSTENLMVRGGSKTASAISSVQTESTYTLTSTVSNFGQPPLKGALAFKDNANHQLPLATVPVGPSSFGFTPPDPSTPSNSSSLGVYDFNRDGKLDQLVYDYAGGNMTILFGKGDGTFTAGPATYIGGAPIAGDFNNDDILDLAAVNGDGTVSIFLGKGDGTFSASTTFSIGQSTGSVSVGDINNDGNLDLMISTASGTGVWFGNGKGGFTLFAPPKLPPGGATIVDLNGDGKPDLILQPDVYTFDVYLGNGDGNFEKLNPLPVTCFQYCYGLVVADFNSDGKPDVVIGDNGEDQTAQGDLYLYLGNGDGTFASPVKFGNDNVFSLALGDFNGDGHADLVDNNGFYGYSTIYLGDGEGNFTTFYPSLPEPSGVVAVGDFNGDGLTDLVVNGLTGVALAEWQSTVTATGVAVPGSLGIHNVFANYEGDATHASSVSAAIPLQGPKAATAVTLEVSPTPVSPSQTMRLVATVTPSVVGEDKATGTITFSNGPNALGTIPVVDGRAVFTSSTLPIGVNINLTAYYSGNVQFSSSVSTPVHLTPGGTLRPATTTVLRVSPSPSVPQGSVVTLSARVIDLGTPAPPGRVIFYSSTSGHPGETVVGHAQVTPSGFAILKFRPPIGSLGLKAVYQGTNNHAGSESAPVSLNVTALISTSTAISVNPPTYSADVTAYGLLAASGDESFVDATDSNLVFATAPLGLASTEYSLTPAASTFLRAKQGAVAVGDFNGDGILDAATVTSSNELIILLGNRNGTFNEKFTASIPGVDIYGVQISVEDFNSDGIPDIAVLQDSQGSLTVFLGRGDGTFLKKSTFAVGAAAASLLVSDFNGDGIPDLLATNQFVGTSTVLLGNGDGTFRNAPQANLGLNPLTGGVVADFNGDGIPDVAMEVLTPSGYALGMLLGIGDGTFVAKSQSLPTGSNCYGTATGADFNGDGIPDLVLMSECSGNLMLLLGKGDATFTASTLTFPLVAPISATTGDLNGDGIPDLILSDQNGPSVDILLGKGDGSFVAGPVAAVPGAYRVWPAVGDFNGDGIPDVLTANADINTMSEWFSSITQTSKATATDIALPGSGTQQVYALYPGDATHTGSYSATAPATGASLTHQRQ